MEELKENEVQPVATLVISLYPNGKLHIDGPIHDKIMAFGMLEVAKIIITNWKRKENIIRPQIIPPNMGRG